MREREREESKYNFRLIIKSKRESLSQSNDQILRITIVDSENTPAIFIPLGILNRVVVSSKYQLITLLIIIQLLKSSATISNVRR